MGNSIITKVSDPILQYRPGGAPVSFEITVTNDSDRFAAFQIEIIAAGADVIPGLLWYRLSPEVGAKKPPGDSTQFTALIIDNPVPGFAGIMNLTVRVFSWELGEETREVIRLVIEQNKELLTPVQLKLPVSEFQAYPSDLLEIPVHLYNPSQLPAQVILSFLGVDPQWLIEGTERRLQIPPGGKADTTFLCQLPVPSEVPSQPYPVTIEAKLMDGPFSHATGTITVLPKGFVEFSCLPIEQQMPSSAWGAWLPQFKCTSASYQLKFDNVSNLQPEVTVQVQPEPGQRKSTWEVIPETANIIPGETTELQLLIHKRRHWWGRSRTLRYEVKASESETDIDIRNDTQFLRLKVLPVLPIWLQVLIIAKLLLIAWACSWLNPQNPFFGHNTPVTSVDLNGLGDIAVSGGNDQKIIEWNREGFRRPLANQFQDHFTGLGKAVRVVRFRPVDNNLVAAGLENGEIQVFDLMADSVKPIDQFFQPIRSLLLHQDNSKKPIHSLLFRKDDRVLNLEFTQDSRFLFSAHGSGLVLQWDLQSNLEQNVRVNNSPVKQKQLDFAVYGLALVGKANQNLMIGGRFNQLRMWDFKTDQVRSLSYPEGSKEDYIQSIAVAAYKPHFMATADNQGYITLWNLESCLSQDADCTIVDRWSNGHGGTPVRSVALTRNGCYLASGGDDGRVMLWPLSSEGKRHPQLANGQPLSQSQQRINSVDTKRIGQEVVVISGSDDTQVRIDFTVQSKTNCQ